MKDRTIFVSYMWQRFQGDSNRFGFGNTTIDHAEKPTSYDVISTWQGLIEANNPPGTQIVILNWQELK